MVTRVSSIILLVVILIAIYGCATFGPGPTDREYSQAIDKLPVAKIAVYIVPAAWYPSVILGDIESFHSPSVTGTLFLTQERLVFATYDSATNIFLQSFSATYSDISWITTKKHGLSRIIRIQSSNNVHSFVYSSGYKNNGEEADKDEIMHFLLDKFKSES